MKKLIFLACASTMAVIWAGCGPSEPIVIDQSILFDGSSNKSPLGGYWWTYVDRTGVSTVTPDTGKVTPKDATSTALKPGIEKGVGKGIEDDGTGNAALHVSGVVTRAPKWTATLGSAEPAAGAADWRDGYVDTNYGSLCVGGKCGEVMYPSAGLGVGIMSKNAPLGASVATGKKGIAFKLKLGAGHGVDAVSTLPYPVAMSMPMDITDVPDWSFADEYGTAHDFSPPTPLFSGAATPTDGKTYPFCTFPNSKKADGTTPWGKDKTCYANLATLIKPAPTKAAWTSYCVMFDTFQPPKWAQNALTTAGVTQVNPVRVIKLQVDAFKPLDTAAEDAAFDLWLDDVILLDDTNIAKWCTGAQTIAKVASADDTNTQAP